MKTARMSLRLAVAAVALSLGLLTSCASRPVPAVTAYDGRPKYPVTKIRLSPTLKMRHIARDQAPDWQTNVRLATDTRDTLSTYTLLHQDGTKLFLAPSSLLNPDFAGEFESWHRQNDRLTVYTSASGRTILIVEDHTSALPLRTYLLLRQDIGYSWTWTSLDIPMFPRRALYVVQYWPRVVGLSDDRIWFHVKGQPRSADPQFPGNSYVRERTWSKSFKDLPAGSFLANPHWQDHEWGLP